MIIAQVAIHWNKYQITRGFGRSLKYLNSGLTEDRKIEFVAQKVSFHDYEETLHNILNMIIPNAIFFKKTKREHKKLRKLKH